MTDPEKRYEIAVTSSLSEHAIPSIDEDDRGIRRRRAGHHVAGVLLVARRVGNDELAPFRREEPVSDVDRNALLALRGQAVDQKSKVEVGALRAEFLGVAGQRGKLVVE